LRVAKEANIKMRPVHITKAQLALVKTTCGKHGGVKVTNLLLAARLKSDHSAVPSRGRISIEGWFNVEIRQNRRLTRLLYRQRVTYTDLQ
jgi:hypothetical protein